MLNKQDSLRSARYSANRRPNIKPVGTTVPNYKNDPDSRMAEKFQESLSTISH